MLNRWLLFSICLGLCWSCTKTSAPPLPEAKAEQSAQPALSPTSQADAARKDKVVALLKEDRLPEAKAIIDPWLAQDPQNPDALFMSGTYYWHHAYRETPAIKDGPPQEGERIVLTELDSDEPIGHLTTVAGYDAKDVLKACAEVDKAIAQRPSRAEFYLFKIYMLSESRLQKELMDAAREFGEVANSELPGFTLHGKPLPKPIQSYAPEFLHSTATGAFLENPSPENIARARELMGLSAKMFPKHSWAYNLLAVMAYNENNLPVAKEMFLKAHGAAPDDSLVAMNVAYVSKELGDMKTAQKFFVYVVEHFPQSDEAQAAKQNLEEIQ